ncbi:uncharacterized protein [Montipora foliosa]|uniref:uncharacterized protein n=1 Tax=Montipora foliosa TaxID=591990 RepID=UPI0035F1FE3E
MKFLIVLALVIPFAAQVRSLQCYVCISTTSMEDCSSSKYAVTCPSYFERPVCSTLEVKYELEGSPVQVFAKGCVKCDQCEDGLHSICTSKESKCNIDCCSGDLCNGNDDEGEDGSAVESLA